MTEPAPLALTGVTRAFFDGAREIRVLTGADLTVEAGELVALVAPSGAGKSTLLQIAGLLERPDAGSVRIDGDEAGALADAARTALRRERIGFVYQFHHLMGDFSARENVALPLRLNGMHAAAARRARRRDPRPARPRPPCHPQAFGPFRRGAPACCHRPRGREQPADPACGRTHGQSGHPHGEGRSRRVSLPVAGNGARRTRCHPQRSPCRAARPYRDPGGRTGRGGPKARLDLLGGVPHPLELFLIGWNQPNGKTRAPSTR